MTRFAAAEAVFIRQAARGDYTLSRSATRRACDAPTALPHDVMPDWFQASYLGIVVFLALTGIGLPIPEEVPIIAAGVASRAGGLE